MAKQHIGVIGAGIVGLAVARRLQQSLGAEVTVVEKERMVAAHQSGHNSNVVHSGIYYQPNSLKAILCRRGVGLMRSYCESHGLPYQEVGKVIVAASQDEMSRLNGLAERALQNGIPDSRIIDDAELREREPHVRGLAALLIPSTSIVDYRRVAESLAHDVNQAGGDIQFERMVTDIRDSGSHVIVETDAGESVFDQVVVCAGLQSSAIARMVGIGADPKIVPFRGEYFELVPQRSGLIRGLVYPVPDPRYPFLGMHFTKDLAGGVHVGPNAVLALAQEGYRRRDINWGEAISIIGYPGVRRLARNHWRTGAAEVAGSLSKSIFLSRAREYVPELTRRDLVRSGSGVRAQALQKDGSLVDDFVIHQSQRVTVVRNAPSPGATASLAIAEHIVEQL